MVLHAHLHFCFVKCYFVKLLCKWLLVLFTLQQIHNFGDPFFLAINDNETLGEIKTRIQKKLHVPDEEFSKVCLSLF